MKRLKRIMALVIAMAMVLGMTSMAAFATEANTYTIIVTNQNTDSATISEKTFNVYKLFDMSYTGTTTVNGEDTSPHAYYLAKDSHFYDGIAGVKNADGITPASDGDIITILKAYFTLTALPGDDTKVLVEPKSDFTEARAYQLGEDLSTHLPATPNASGTVAEGEETVTIDVSNKGDAGYYLVTGSGAAVDEDGKVRLDDEGNEESVMAAVALTSTDPKAEIKAKLDAPSVKKEVEQVPAIPAGEDPVTHEVHEEAVDAVYDSTNNASIGDTINYKVSSKVPDMTGYEKYYFYMNDTMAKGLTLVDDYEAGNNAKPGGFTITIGTGATAKTLVRGTDYDITKGTDDDGNTTIEILFKNFVQYKGHLVTAEEAANEEYVAAHPGAAAGKYVDSREGQPILITYSAVVNSDAVIGKDGNPNDIDLTYSNKPNVTPEGENKPGENDTNVTGTTPKSETKTYVSGVELIKVNGTGERLEGAEFEITGDKVNIVVVENETFEQVNGTTVALGEGDVPYFALKDGSYTTTNPTTLDSTASNYEETIAKYEDATGVTQFKKTVTKNVVTTTESVTATGTTTADGTLVFNGLGAGTYTITELKSPTGYNLLKTPLTLVVEWENPDDIAPTATAEQLAIKNAGGFKKVSTDNSEEVNFNTDTGTYEITVLNQTGTELPSTGGIGTTIFYVVGAILVIGAGVILITRRRMDA